MADYHLHPNFALFENATVLVSDSHKAHLLTILKDRVEEGDHFNAETNEFSDKEGFFANGPHAGAPENHSDEEYMKKFAKRLCDALFKKHQHSALHKLVICAPAKMLHHIEDNLHQYLKDILEKTVQGEFTNMPHHEVVSHL